MRSRYPQDQDNHNNRAGKDTGESHDGGSNNYSPGVIAVLVRGQGFTHFSLLENVRFIYQSIRLASI
jgi:hypothetical protein